MMLRDTRRNQAYFSKLVNDLDGALEETQVALDSGHFKMPSERVDVALRLFQLSVMRVVAQYSKGVPIETLALNVFAILPYRQQLTRLCDELPQQHQFYRDDFEKLGDADDACGSPNINRYVYTLWWLAFLEVCGAPRNHVQDALNVIGEQGKDALLDKIAIRLGDINRPISSSLSYPEVYQTLNDAFDTDYSEQPQLLNQFIAEWYENLEEADWYENHDVELEFEYTDYYIGYWSFEYVLVANLLDLSKVQLSYHPMVARDLIKK